MSEPSDWPLSSQAIRIRVPASIEKCLAKHALSQQLYVTAIGYYPHAELHKMKRANHDDYILIYCLDGEGELSSGQFKGKVKVGDVFVLPPDMQHEYKSSLDEPWTVFWFHFRGRMAQQYFDYLFEAASGPVLSIHDASMPGRFRELIENAKNCYGLDSYIYLNSLLVPLFVAIARSGKNESKTGMGLDLAYIQDFMRKNIGRTLRLEDIANFANVSKYHFSRKYHTLTGMTPLQHFSILKIEHACILLEQTNASISDIAYQLGYDDALYFSRVFKKIMATSPRTYRKSLSAHK